jgi:2-keto-4-pentenoate hydratase/2-oxohepta-3-ene-1,7-dioic acid hydratase in catechol pathway
MKLLSYFSSAGPRAGLLLHDQVYDLARVAPEWGFELPSEMRQLLQLERIDLVQSIADKLTASQRSGMPLAQVRLAAPVPRPDKILALAGNYREHIREGGGRAVDRANSTPRVFIKPASTINYHEGLIRIPRRSNAIDYEIELGVVIGRRCRYLNAAHALDAVVGYTVVNDVSARTLAIHESRTPRDGDHWFDWLNGKWFDTFAPMGPYLATADEVGDPQSLKMKLWVNGKLRQDADTGQMIYNVAELLVWITEFVTLEPGDVIATGTPAGVGHTTQTYLQPGDVVEAEIERIGCLRSTIAAEEAQ